MCRLGLVKFPDSKSLVHSIGDFSLWWAGCFTMDHDEVKLHRERRKKRLTRGCPEKGGKGAAVGEAACSGTRHTLQSIALVACVLPRGSTPLPQQPIWL